MGFRKDSYATVWEVKPRSNTMTSVRISINRKDKQTGEYVHRNGFSKPCLRMILRM